MNYKVRDRREKGWFYLDNEYLNGYARVFGAVGTAIYMSLCRHANNETQRCFPSMVLIGEELGISRNTVAKYLKLFEEKNLIVAQREKDEEGKWKNTVYYLLDKSEWTPHAQPVSMENHAQPVSKPCTNDEENHAQPLGNKETKINYTNITRLKRESTPSEISKDFFSKGKTYEEYMALFESVPKDTLSAEFDKFILYWTEMNGSGTKQRWQLQSTFDVKRRLVTWLGKINSFSSRREVKII